MISKRLGILVVAAVLLFAGERLTAQTSPAVPVEQIIARFTALEAVARRAYMQYDFEQEVRVQEMRGRGVTGEFQLVVVNSLDKNGQRAPRVVYQPPSTLRRIALTPEDIEDIFDVQPFAVRTDNIEKYDLRLEGEARIKDTSCYVLDVKPRRLEKGERYFQGKIWVAMSDFHVVKTSGKSVPDIRSGPSENLFPNFENFRVKVDEYSFPDSMQSNQPLNFPTGSVDIRVMVTYGKYRRP
jgi:hypothetical protein